MTDILDMNAEELLAWLKETQKIEDTHSWLYGHRSVTCTICGCSKGSKQSRQTCGEYDFTAEREEKLRTVTLPKSDVETLLTWAASMPGFWQREDAKRLMSALGLTPAWCEGSMPEMKIVRGPHG